MYKFDYDVLYDRWNVYFVHEEKQDFIMSFTDVEAAHDYCVNHNYELLKIGDHHANK